MELCFPRNSWTPAFPFTHGKWWMYSLFCFACGCSFCFTCWIVFILIHEFSQFCSSDPLLHPNREGRMRGEVSELQLSSWYLGLNNDTLVATLWIRRNWIQQGGRWFLPGEDACAQLREFLEYKVRRKQKVSKTWQIEKILPEKGPADF